MLSSLVGWLRRRTVWQMWILSVSLLAVAVAIYFAGFRPRSEELARHSESENPIIDSWGWYGPDRFYALVHDRWAAEQRWYYVRVQCLDLVFAAAYAGLFVVLQVWCLRGMGVGVSELAWLAVLPLLAFLADEAENICLIALILANDPDFRVGVWVASCFTAVKFFGFVGSVATVLTAAWLRLGFTVGRFPELVAQYQHGH